MIRLGQRAYVAAAAFLLALASCGGAHGVFGRSSGSGSSRSPGEARARAPRPPPPPEWFWEPIDADVRAPGRKPIDLPLTTEVARLEGATRIWDELAPDARDRLRKDGVLVMSALPAVEASDAGAAAGPSGANTLGAFYMDLRERRIPHIITLETLFAFTTLALESALAEVEENDLAPSLISLIEKLDTRLAKEEVGAGSTELTEGYRVARGVVGVARALASPTSPVMPSTDPLASIVGEEKNRVEAHAGVANSTMLGVPIDYARFVVPSAASRPGTFRALAWLSAAPFSLIARHEAPGSAIDLAQARTNARAAMLLARLTDREVDPAINALYTHTLKLLAFVWGAPDDLTLREIDELGEQAQIDVQKLVIISNVARVDKLRARALAGRAPAAFDGSGGAFRGGISARVFGGYASGDSLAMQALVGAPVGLAQESAAAASIDRLRAGKRVLPATLDVMAWLGAPEARTALHESHADAFDGYEKALANVIRTRPSDQSVALHASVYGSLIDALIAWGSPSEPLVSPPVIERTQAGDRAHLESMLSSWTMIRHTSAALARPKPSVTALSTELRVSGGPLPIYIEAVPDVIARLVATVHQVHHGFEKLSPLPPTSNASALLVEVEDLLRVSLKGSERHASDEPLTTEEATTLASLPARLLRIEDAAASSQSVGPQIAIVYSDPSSHRVLATATGRVEPILTFARESGKDEPVLVVGAHIAHHEIVESLEPAGAAHAAIVTDAAWRTRLAPSKAATANVKKPENPAWAQSFRLAR